MPFLQINGITVPVAEWSRSQRPIGDSGRAFSGQQRSTRRALKRSWRITTTPLTRVTAEALLALLQGQGDAWAFDSDLYSAKGNAMSSGTGIAVSAIQSKYGASSLALTGDGVAASRDSDSGKILQPAGITYTLAAWMRSDLTAGGQRLQVREFDENDTLLQTLSIDGANDSAWAYRSATKASHASVSYVKVRTSIHTTPSGSAYFDDVLFVPAELSTGQLDAIEAAGRAVAGPPRVNLTGDVVGSEVVPCEATIERVEGEQFASGSTWQNTGQVLDFELVEV
jgi:hypothetical protein